MRPPPASSLLGLPEPPLLSFPPSRLRRSPPLAPLSTGATPGAGRPGRPLFPYGRATFPGLQLLLGPGTSGVDVTFILLVLDAKASRTRHEVRRARGPAPPARAPATPPASRTGPAPSRRLAPPTPRLHAALAPHSLILYPAVRRCSMPPRPRCRLAPDAATPPMPPRPRCRLAPRCCRPRCRLALRCCPRCRPRCPLAPMPSPMPRSPRLLNIHTFFFCDAGVIFFVWRLKPPRGPGSISLFRWVQKGHQTLVVFSFKHRDLFF